MEVPVDLQKHHRSVQECGLFGRERGQTRREGCTGLSLGRPRGPGVIFLFHHCPETHVLPFLAASSFDFQSHQLQVATNINNFTVEMPALCPPVAHKARGGGSSHDPGDPRPSPTLRLLVQSPNARRTPSAVPGSVCAVWPCVLTLLWVSEAQSPDADYKRPEPQVLGASSPSVVWTWWTPTPPAQALTCVAQAATGTGPRTGPSAASAAGPGLTTAPSAEAVCPPAPPPACCSPRVHTSTFRRKGRCPGRALPHEQEHGDAWAAEFCSGLILSVAAFFYLKRASKLPDVFYGRNKGLWNPQADGPPSQACGPLPKLRAQQQRLRVPPRLRDPCPEAEGPPPRLRAPPG
ncbi:uncharacterized protein C1orf159 homolog isoform X2 [Monodon monoceros]|uniref:uncharacterized protein C1orf159 homolog isoform X2 n=1 Tax=Monodon monoceros TaxID=40151 RepID=UPI0010F465E6|nr:uncharacterized protein C1orf159 homolog isoform X2 [Monodon monoceros]